MSRVCGDGVDPALVEFGPHRGEELPRQRADEPRPDVARVPVAVDLGDPLVRRRVVGADRQQHVARQRDLLQRRRTARRSRPRPRARVARRVHPPAGRVVGGHVVGQQAAARRRDPLELAGELHALGIAARPAIGPHWWYGPRAHELDVSPASAAMPRELRVVPEHVELPRGGRVGAEHVALKADAVHEVADRRLGAGEVGVGLVVGAAHDLDAAVGDAAGAGRRGPRGWVSQYGLR